ncbi:hypothetical protein N0V82_008806 [Gnomoniopsis sp. IMI 355080]|nr:hypothetical protein N0V82_008806 [Gnomoniopsis sp. IMI 355080]
MSESDYEPSEGRLSRSPPRRTPDPAEVKRDLDEDLAGLDNIDTTTITSATGVTPCIANVDNMTRRSARAAAVVANNTGVAPPGAPSVRIAGHRRPPAVGSADAAIQALLMLPGFAWEEDLSWVFHRENRELYRMLGAEVYEGTWRPAADQQFVTARVADLIEACCDEWLEGHGPKGEWQDGALLAPFWDQAAVRLSDTTSYWRHHNPTATHIFKATMTYTARFDPKGRGTTEEEDQWGFRTLTWGDRKAQIDIDIRAKPWNAARDFYEYLNDTENDYGPIKPPNGTKPEQAKAFLTWNPASIPVVASASVSKKAQAPCPPTTPPQTQGSDSDVEMVGAGPVYEKQGTKSDTDMKDAAPAGDRSNDTGPCHQGERPTIYGPRDPDIKIVAERINIPEDVEASQGHKLIITFKNLDLKGKGKQEEVDKPLSPMQDSEDFEDLEDVGHSHVQALTQTPSGAGGVEMKNKKKNKKKKNKGRKNNRGK